MVDTVLRLREPAERSSILQQLGMETFDANRISLMPYGVVTLHRPSNVVDLAIFRDILDPLLTIGGEGAARLSYPSQNVRPHQ